MNFVIALFSLSSLRAYQEKEPINAVQRAQLSKNREEFSFTAVEQWEKPDFFLRVSSWCAAASDRTIDWFDHRYTHTYIYNRYRIRETTGHWKGQKKGTAPNENSPKFRARGPQNPRSKTMRFQSLDLRSTETKSRTTACSGRER